jgi:hypothetical protein
MLIDICYPTLDALIPSNGIYLRMLLQDLEFDHINVNDAEDGDSEDENKIVSICQSYLTTTDVVDVTRSSLDRSLLASEYICQGNDTEEEVILVCLRVLTLLLSR